MRRKAVAVSLCVFIVLSIGISLVACNKIKADLLGEPKQAVALSYDELQNNDFVAFKGKTEKFASMLAASAYEDFSGNGNFVLSPVSVFFALSIASECTNEDARAEILSALGVSYEELQSNFPLLYRSLFIEQKAGSRVINQLSLANSIWLDKSASVNRNCINKLADKYYTYSYAADFKGKNSSANDAVRQFVKNKTNKLIDKNFDLSQDTIFAIINTLYLKTIWNHNGDELPFTPQEYAFTSGDGSVTRTKLLLGNYHSGRVYDAQTYSAFYTLTDGDFKIKFMLPKQGYSVDDIFTEANIATVNALNDFNEYDMENDIYYETRCIFPEYKCTYDQDLKEILQNTFGINKLFINATATQNGNTLSSITDTPCFCNKIDHVVSLDVNKKGIEGAAATVISGATGPRPADVKLDFVIDRSFGFIITDSQNITLFSGVVKTI